MQVAPMTHIDESELNLWKKFSFHTAFFLYMLLGLYSPMNLCGLSFVLPNSLPMSSHQQVVSNLNFRQLKQINWQCPFSLNLIIFILSYVI